MQSDQTEKECYYTGTQLTREKTRSINQQTVIYTSAVRLGDA